MYRAILAALVIDVFAFSVLPARAGDGPTPISAGTTYILKSADKGKTYEVNIFTPRRYETDLEASFPVLYVIDGGLDQDFLHIAGLADLAAVNGNYEDLIVVGIRTNNRVYELTTAPTDPRYVREEGFAGGSGEFRAFIQDVVIPFVESSYRAAERRAVIGESLAGLFITETFLTAPATFTDYISVSPSLWYDDRRLAKDAAEHLKNHDETPRRLYLTMADEGGTMQMGLDEVVAALGEYTPEGLKWTYVDRRESEHHWTIYHGAALDALRWAFGLPAPEFGETPWYLIDGANPPGWQDPEQAAEKAPE